MPTDPSTPPVQVDLLPYEARLDARPASAIDLVVIHCTELPDLAMARRYGEEVLYPGSQTGNSGHYYIDRDGAVHQYVSIDRKAHHTRGYNDRSVGVELVNRGRYPDWLAAGHQAMDEPYTDAQVVADRAVAAPAGRAAVVAADRRARGPRHHRGRGDRRSR